jgi:hypothetical protein
VPLGGSLRASRAALLARPLGPLVAVDLADGRSLTVEDLGAGWVACAAVADAPVLRSAAGADVDAERVAVPARRRRLGTAVVLAGALGAAVVALATGFSGAPAPAVAGPVAHPDVPRPPAVLPLLMQARGGRAKALPPATPPPRPPKPAVPAAPAVVAPPPAPPAPPPLPELPSVPAL